jgi:hypothetical protein
MIVASWDFGFCELRSGEAPQILRRLRFYGRLDR